MGGQIRRGWIWRFWGTPVFRPEVPKPFKNWYLGTSGLKIGAPQKRQILPWQIWPPLCGPLKYIYNSPGTFSCIRRGSNTGTACIGTEMNSPKSLAEFSENKSSNIFSSTVRAEIITELVLKRAGPVIFKTFLLELMAFRPIPVIYPARGVKPDNYWKR